MAVTPIRRQMSVVPASAPVPMVAPPQPSQQDWVWDGANWQWSGCCPPTPPPCPPPWWWSVAPCPPPVAPPSLPPPLTGPIIGVTDGSNAAAGQVGEFISAESSFPYTAYPNITNANLSVIIIQPGDWDLWASLQVSTAIGGALFYLSPIPTGILSTMASASVLSGMSISEVVSVTSSVARGNFTVPTLMAFYVSVDQATSSTLTAGTATLIVSGRRRR